ncbi:hypothetical protein J5N97_027129 [Dioscorea zingiberensis]|uniref:YTH domain-containing family protein n=1 Tax=Dioscorea zingiberensis TaxID=325984 RepID=A0A9D5C3Q1_9LILI|nr:hypothetical protein J5N97_027129 [Dioscorea zingiberensis]
MGSSSSVNYRRYSATANPRPSPASSSPAGDDHGGLLPTIIVERAGSYAWTHKSWRVREEFARTVATTIGLFASTEATLQPVLLPPVLQLLSDSNNSVREAAIACLEILRGSLWPAKTLPCFSFLFSKHWPIMKVNASGHFCGVAEMVGPADFSKDMDFWQQDKWIGSFTVKWHIMKDVPNTSLRHIIVENNENRPVTSSRDTQEVPYLPGLSMLHIFKNLSLGTSLLDDFMFYEERQKIMEEERSRLPRRGYMSFALSLSVPSHRPSDSVYLGPVIFENQLNSAIDADISKGGEQPGVFVKDNRVVLDSAIKQLSEVDENEPILPTDNSPKSDEKKHQLYGICLPHWLYSLLSQGSCNSVGMEMYKGSDQLMTETCMMPELVLDQGLYYYPAAANYYGYHCTGFESPSELDDHHMFFGLDGQDLHANGANRHGSAPDNVMT